MKCRYFCRLPLDISPVYLTRGISLFALIAAVNVIIVIIIYIFTLFLWTWGEIYLNINYIIHEKERYITFECYCISNVL